MKKKLFLLCGLVLLLAGCETAGQTDLPGQESGVTSVVSAESTSMESLPADEESVPPIVIQPPEDPEVPVDGEQMEGTFGQYTFVSEENGKSVAGIFSQEQIRDITARRESGEWMTVTYEEMLYLVQDTVELFEEYDIVRLTDLTGKVHSYYGKRFYTSEEYYACFNRLASPEDPACSFDLDQDIRDVIFMRLEVLHSAVCYEFKSITGADIGGDPKIMYFGLDGEKTAQELSSLSTKVWTVYNDRRTIDLSASPWGILVFHSADLYGVPDISVGDPDRRTDLDPGNHFPYNAGKYEYGNMEKTVVVEIQETQNYYTVARVRIDDPDALEELGRLWSGLATASGKPDDDFMQNSAYRIMVYLNGFPDYRGGMDDPNGPAFRSFFYRSDGKFNSYSLAANTTVEQDIYCMGGCSELAGYINRLVEEILKKA